MSARPAAPSTDELLRLFLEQGQDFALLLLTPEGVVLDWLAGAERVFGFSAEEMTGQPLKRIFTPEDLAHGADEHELRIGRAGAVAEDDRWQMRKDGTAFWASGFVTPLRDGAGRVVAFAKLLRNRTDVKTETEALENRMKALAEEQERSKAFFGVVVHELRNPLAPIASAAELIRRTAPADATADAALRIIDRQVAGLGRLVDDLMQMVRIGAGKVELQRRVLDLKEIMTAAADAARPLAHAREQEFQVLLIEGPVPVNADVARLEQVFANLLNNAIKYTPPQGRIWFKLTIEGGDAIVRVEDNGVGIGPETLPRLFDLFTQEKASRDMASGGLGVGLSVVRQLVTAHGGTAQARSDGRGKGSVFTVRLPIHGATQP